MPILDNSINKFIDDSLIAENEAREHEHVSSGKLSASTLYQPLRFQVLKTIGAPRKPFDSYVLGKFIRGNQCEDWFVKLLDASWVDDEGVEHTGMGILKGKQVKIEYRDCVGFADCTIDTDLMYCKKGIMPNEIKSVTNAKLKRIGQTGIDYHYKMQACYYALGLGTRYYAITIISGEDLQRSLYIFEVNDGGIKDDVERAITAYQLAMEKWKTDKVLPAFAPNPKVPWTANLQYSMFEPFWATAPDNEVIKKLSELGLA